VDADTELTWQVILSLSAIFGALEEIDVPLPESGIPDGTSAPSGATALRQFLTGGDFDRLARLRLLPARDPAGGGDWSGIAPAVLSATLTDSRMPRLLELEVEMAGTGAEDFVARLARWPGLKRLESLDVRGCLMGEVAAGLFRALHGSELRRLGLASCEASEHEWRALLGLQTRPGLQRLYLEQARYYRDGGWYGYLAATPLWGELVARFGAALTDQDGDHDPRFWRGYR
jgi:hypothetical protein